MTERSPRSVELSALLALGCPEGLLMEEFGGNCPVQAEGRFQGQPFYFRARSASWALHWGARAVSSLAMPFARGSFGNAGYLSDPMALRLMSDHFEALRILWDAPEKNQDPALLAALALDADALRAQKERLPSLRETRFLNQRALGLLGIACEISFAPASLGSFPDFFQPLLSQDPDLRDARRLECVRILLNAGFDPNELSGPGGLAHPALNTRPLSWACALAPEETGLESAAISHALMSAGADPFLSSGALASPFSQAIDCHNFPLALDLYESIPEAPKSARESFASFSLHLLAISRFSFANDGEKEPASPLNENPQFRHILARVVSGEWDFAHLKELRGPSSSIEENDWQALMSACEEGLIDSHLPDQERKLTVSRV